MEHGVLDPRLRAARDRGLELLLGRLLPSGSLGVGGEDPFELEGIAVGLIRNTMLM